MADNQARPLADIAFAAAVILFAGFVYWGTLELPPPRYEPMGSAALPRALAVIMAALALIVGIRGWRRLTAEERQEDEPLPYKKRPWLAGATVVILSVYLIVLEQRIASFIPSSILAFSLFGCMLVKFEPKRSALVIGFTILLVLLSYVTFTKLFYVDLP